MSDESWRSRRDDDFSEFGSLFDDAEPTQNLPPVEPDGSTDEPAADAVDGGDSEGGEALSFGDGGTGSLPHWTEPATGETPRFEADPADAGPPAESDDELDVWSSFSSESPVWKDDEPVDPGSIDENLQTAQQRRVTDQHGVVSGQQRRVTGESAAVEAEPSRITIGTDPSGMPRRQPAGGGRRRGAPPPRRAQAAGGPTPSKAGRDMPVAIAVGLVLAAVFTAALMYRPVAAAAFIVVLLGLAAVEFYDKVAEKGYRPAVVPGIVGCVAAPLAAYWLGVGALPLVFAFGFMATAGSFIGARNVEAGPMPNVSITTLGFIWIGLLGSFAMLILRLSTNSGSLLEVAEHRGTDTLFLLALGVVANDVGALFVGSAVGRTPLRTWISPNKTVEGLIGGAVLTVIVMVLVGISESSDTWSSTWHLFALAIVISVMAPMGD
ncbi:MAG: phosphatidate cytidylyltransferase, partial [Ilumatobacter sp.]|nr:phosphatidate cytidylyltransferase [Ilumatobacter sp.]